MSKKRESLDWYNSNRPKRPSSLLEDFLKKRETIRSTPSTPEPAPAPKPQASSPRVGFPSFPLPEDIFQTGPSGVTPQLTRPEIGPPTKQQMAQEPLTSRIRMPELPAKKTYGERVQERKDETKTIRSYYERLPQIPRTPLPEAYLNLAGIQANVIKDPTTGRTALEFLLSEDIPNELAKQIPGLYDKSTGAWILTEGVNDQNVRLEIDKLVNRIKQAQEAEPKGAMDQFLGGADRIAATAANLMTGGNLYKNVHPSKLPTSDIKIVDKIADTVGFLAGLSSGQGTIGVINAGSMNAGQVAYGVAVKLGLNNPTGINMITKAVESAIRLGMIRTTSGKSEGMTDQQAIQAGMKGAVAGGIAGPASVLAGAHASHVLAKYADIPKQYLFNFLKGGHETGTYFGLLSAIDAAMDPKKGVGDVILEGLTGYGTGYVFSGAKVASQAIHDQFDFTKQTGAKFEKLIRKKGFVPFEEHSGWAKQRLYQEYLIEMYVKDLSGPQGNVVTLEDLPKSWSTGVWINPKTGLLYIQDASKDPQMNLVRLIAASFKSWLMGDDAADGFTPTGQPQPTAPAQIGGPGVQPVASAGVVPPVTATPPVSQVAETTPEATPVTPTPVAAQAVPDLETPVEKVQAAPAPRKDYKKGVNLDLLNEQTSELMPDEVRSRVPEGETPYIPISKEDYNSRLEVKIADILAKRLGLDLSFFKNNPNLEGVEGIEDTQNFDGFFKQGKLFIDFNSEDPIRKVLGHEFYHSLTIEEKEELNEIIQDIMRNPEAKGHIKELKAVYKEAGIDLGKWGTHEELGAELSGELFVEEDFWERVKKHSPSLAKRMWTIIENLLKKLKAMMKGQPEIEQPVSKFVKDLEKARNILARIVGERIERVAQIQDAAKKVTKPVIGAQKEVADGSAAVKRDKENRKIYSTMAKVIEEKMPDNMVVKEVLKLVKSKQVPDDEQKWTGVVKWLEGLPPTDKVTKQEVLNKIKETSPKISRTIQTGSDLKYPNLDAYRRTIPEPHLKEEQFYELDSDLLPAELAQTQANQRQIKALYEELENLNAKYIRASAKEPVAPTIKDQKRMDQLKKEIESLEATIKDDKILERTNFHWLRNARGPVLGHSRVMYHVHPQLGQVLDLRELQSDWHQRGKKHGYQEQGEAPVKHSLTAPIMDAPLRTTWTDYLIKNALLDMAERGVKTLTWTTSEQQVKLGGKKSGHEVHYGKVIPKAIQRALKRLGINAEIKTTQMNFPAERDPVLEEVENAIELRPHADELRDFRGEISRIAPREQIDRFLTETGLRGKWPELKEEIRDQNEEWLFVSLEGEVLDSGHEWLKIAELASEFIENHEEYNLTTEELEELGDQEKRDLIDSLIYHAVTQEAGIDLQERGFHLLTRWSQTMHPGGRISTALAEITVLAKSGIKEMVSLFISEGDMDVTTPEAAQESFEQFNEMYNLYTKEARDIAVEVFSEITRSDRTPPTREEIMADLPYRLYPDHISRRPQQEVVDYVGPVSKIDTDKHAKKLANEYGLKELWNGAENIRADGDEFLMTSIYLPGEEGRDLTPWVELQANINEYIHNLLEDVEGQVNGIERLSLEQSMLYNTIRYALELPPDTPYHIMPVYNFQNEDIIEEVWVASDDGLEGLIYDHIDDNEDPTLQETIDLTGKHFVQPLTGRTRDLLIDAVRIAVEGIEWPDEPQVIPAGTAYEQPYIQLNREDLKKIRQEGFPRFSVKKKRKEEKKRQQDKFYESQHIYSKLEDVITNRVTDNQSASQILSFLQKEIKDSELDWTGTRAWLKAKGDTQVKREDLLTQVLASRLKLREVVLDRDDNELQQEQVALQDRVKSLRSKLNQPHTKKLTPKEEAKILDEMASLEMAMLDNERYGKYHYQDLVNPKLGGKGYAEIILTLYSPGEELEKLKEEYDQYNDYKNALERINNQVRSVLYIRATVELSPSEYRSIPHLFPTNNVDRIPDSSSLWTMDIQELKERYFSIREDIAELDSEREQTKMILNSLSNIGTHYDFDGAKDLPAMPIAHTRVDFRNDVNGNLLMKSHENQSDLMQKIRDYEEHALPMDEVLGAYKQLHKYANLDGMMWDRESDLLDHMLRTNEISSQDHQYLDVANTRQEPSKQLLERLKEYSSVHEHRLSGKMKTYMKNYIEILEKKVESEEGLERFFTKSRDTKIYPITPFANEWGDLLFKRELAYAIEHGAKGMVLASAKEQLARFSTDGFWWRQTADNSFMLYYTPTGANGAINHNLARMDDITYDDLETTAHPSPPMKKIVSSREDLDVIFSDKRYKGDAVDPELYQSQKKKLDTLWKKMQETRAQFRSYAGDGRGVYLPRKEGFTYRYDILRPKAINKMLKPFGIQLEEVEALSADRQAAKLQEASFAAHDGYYSPNNLYITNQYAVEEFRRDGRLKDIPRKFIMDLESLNEELANHFISSYQEVIVIPQKVFTNQGFYFNDKLVEALTTPGSKAFKLFSVKKKAYREKQAQKQKKVEKPKIKVADIKKEARDKLLEQIAEATERKRFQSEVKKTREALGDLRKSQLRPHYKAMADELFEQFDHKKLGNKAKLRLEESLKFFEKEERSNPGYEIPTTMRSQLERLSKKQIDELTFDEMAILQNAIKHITHLNKLTNKLIGRKALRDFTNAKTKILAEIALPDSVEEVKKFSNFDMLNSAAAAVDFMYGVGSLRPDMVVRKVTGWAKDSELKRWLNDDLVEAQDVALRSERLIEETVNSKIKGIELKTWDGPKAKQQTYLLPSGSIKLTNAELVGLYLHSQAPDNREYLLSEGYAKRDWIKSRKLTENDLAAIASHMTPEHKKVANAILEAYQIMRGLINKASVELDGFEKANVDVYVPILQHRLLNNSNYHKYVRPATLEGAGYLKQRIGGGGPILLEGIFETFERSKLNVASYAGYSKALRNAKMILGDAEVKAALAGKEGRVVEKYMEALFQDLELNNYIMNPYETFWDKTISKAQSAILGLNPGVWVKQLASAPLAMIEIEPKYWLAGLGDKLDWDWVMDISPVMWKRRQGYVDRSSGEVTQRRQAYRSSLAWTTQPIQVFDRYAIRPLWTGAIRKAMAETGLSDKGDPKFRQAVKEIGERALFKGQPNYTSMQRSWVGRTRSLPVRLISVFSTQRNQLWNIQWEAAVDLKKGDVKSAAGKLAAVTMSAFMIGVINMTRAKWRRRDSDGLAKEIALSLAGNAYGFESFVNMFLDGFKRENMMDSQINNLIMNTRDLFNIDSPRTAQGKVLKLAETFSTINGVPLQNTLNEFRSVIYQIDPVMGYEWDKIWKNPTTTEQYKMLFQEAKKYDSAHEAIVKSPLIKVLREDMIEAGVTTSSVLSSKAGENSPLAAGLSKYFPTTAIKKPTLNKK